MKLVVIGVSFCFALREVSHMQPVVRLPKRTVLYLPRETGELEFGGRATLRISIDNHKIVLLIVNIINHLYQT